MTKKRHWYEKHHEENDKLRAMSGAKPGDGLKLLEKMRTGNGTQRALYSIYRHMPADQADAIISLYTQNPLLRVLFEGKLPPAKKEKDTPGNAQDPSPHLR